MTATYQDTFHNGALLEDSKVPWLHLLEIGGDGTLAQGEPPFLYISTLVRAQREMNSTRGNTNTQMIVPLLAAFAILDQIGKCYGFYSKVAGEPDAKPSIKRALHHFPLPWGSPLSAEEMQALYVMRNGLMHDAAFSSREERGTKRSMIFRHDIEMENVVTLPARVWNGTPDDVCRETITWINPDLLIWIADSAIGRLGQALKLNDPDLYVRLDCQEIAAKYLLWSKYVPHNGSGPNLLKPDRNEAREALRRRLSEAEVKLHQQRYSPD